jgi:signal transduction histidine kinase
MDGMPRSPLPPPGHLLDGHTRLAWLIRLRWAALAGVALAAALAEAGLVPGVNVRLVAAAVLLGVLTNLVLSRRSRQHRRTDEHHVGQALLDTGALTLVVWAAGGADCPFIGFYAFPVLLAALLGDRPALLPAGLATAAGLAFQVAATIHPALAVGRWDPPPRWHGALAWAAAALTVAGVAYFAMVFSEAIRAQARARRDADTLLRLSLEGLDVGLEVVEGEDVVWQNAEASELMGARQGQRWQCPGGTAHCRPGGCAFGPGHEGRRRCQFPMRGAGAEASERIFEMLVFPLGELDRPRVMVLYLDRTSEVLAQRHLVFTERLASLGRTVQGVAHELNTPLATIQTLARDTADVLAAGGPSTPADRADLLDSGRLIVAEVDRCRRITHALLGRVESLREGPATTPLGEAVQRAVAVVFTHERAQVHVDLPEALARRVVPLDPVVQVLVNLLQNARDARHEGRVVLRGVEAGGVGALQIEDEGPGLAPDALAHLFEPFFTTKPPGQGTGLGLYTSYTLVQSLGGRLALENGPTGGAVATLELPAFSDPSSAAPASR